MPKRTDEMIFISECPSEGCNNRNRITWLHYGCPFNIPLYISTKGIMRCENCGMEEYYANCKFNCGYHEGESYSARFRSPTKLKAVLSVLGDLADEGIISNDFAIILALALREQVNRLKGKNDY